MIVLLFFLSIEKRWQCYYYIRSFNIVFKSYIYLLFKTFKYIDMHKDLNMQGLFIVYLKDLIKKIDFPMNYHEGHI